MMGSFDPQGAGQMELAPAQVIYPARSFTPLQILFLRRLAKLIHQRRECQKLVDAADWHLALLSKAIYSTYCDALALDLTVEAGMLLGSRQEQVAN